jgi:hypothetical protein
MPVLQPVGPSTTQNMEQSRRLVDGVRIKPNLQPQRDSNPCRHLERVVSVVHQNRPNTIDAGKTSSACRVCPLLSIQLGRVDGQLDGQELAGLGELQTYIHLQSSSPRHTERTGGFCGSNGQWWGQEGAPSSTSQEGASKATHWSQDARQEGCKAS